MQPTTKETLLLAIKDNITWSGIMHVTNKAYETDPRPIDEQCDCPCCRNFTRAYVRHLFKSEEQLGGRLAVMHNLYFYNTLMEKITPPTSPSTVNSPSLSTMMA